MVRKMFCSDCRGYHRPAACPSPRGNAEMSRQHQDKFSNQVQYDHPFQQMSQPEFQLKDSGQREQFSTGSQRDSREGKGRFDLIPTQELRRLAQVYEKGAIKYDADNWRKGQPLRRYLDSAMRHLVCAQERQEDEDHIMQAAWNCFAFAYTQRLVREGRLPAELDDLPLQS